MSYPLMRHMHAEVCKSLTSHYFEQYFSNNPYHSQHELNQGVVSPGLTDLTYRWRERASGNMTQNTSEANHSCTRVYVLISVRKKGGLSKSSCHGCTALHRRRGPAAPRDKHSLAESHHFFLNLTSNHGAFF